MKWGGGRRILAMGTACAKGLLHSTDPSSSASFSSSLGLKLLPDYATGGQNVDITSMTSSDKLRSS